MSDVDGLVEAALYAEFMPGACAGRLVRVADARDTLATARDAWHVARGLEA